MKRARAKPGDSQGQDFNLASLLAPEGDSGLADHTEILPNNSIFQWGRSFLKCPDVVMAHSMIPAYAEQIYLRFVPWQLSFTK